MRYTKNNLRALADANGYLYEKNRKTPTVKIWPDGTLTRADTDFHLCRAMTVKETVRLLGLPNGH